MIRYTFCLSLLALVLASALSACAYRIDESAVFMPPETRSRVEGVGDMSLRDEAELTGLGATVTHSVERFGSHDIALTVASIPAGVGDPARPLILSCSGNASDRPNTGTNYAAKVLPFGDAVLWDYPGYGDSSGVAGVAAIEDVSGDLLAWLDARAGDRPVILWGHSLGGFVCGELARDAGFVDAVILETTARNVEEVARAWKPWWLPVRLRAVDALKAYDTADALARFPGPVVVLGAGRDGVLPVKLHRSLAAALPQARYLEMAEATHYSAGFDPRAVELIRELAENLSDGSSN